jgi:hypothetical protein
VKTLCVSLALAGLAVALAAVTALASVEPAGTVKQKGSKKVIEKIVKTEAEWKQQLTPEQFYVLRKQGTERAFTGALWNNQRPQPVHDAHRGALRPLRRAFGPRLRGRPQAHRPALLHQLGLPRVRTRQEVEK